MLVPPFPNLSSRYPTLKVTTEIGPGYWFILLTFGILCFSHLFCTDNLTAMGIFFSVVTEIKQKCPFLPTITLWKCKCLVVLCFLMCPLFFYLAVKDEAEPGLLNDSLKARSTKSHTLSNAVPITEGPEAVRLVNNRKGSLYLSSDSSLRRLSLLNTSDQGRGAQCRLQRARSLPVKYRYHPNNATCDDLCRFPLDCTCQPVQIHMHEILALGVFILFPPKTQICQVMIRQWGPPDVILFWSGVNLTSAQ